jgi:N-acetyltransferase
MRDGAFREPVTLTGRVVELVPLERSHREAVLAAAHDAESQRLLYRAPGRTLADVDRYLDGIFAEQASGSMLPFATRLRSDHRLVGVTGYLRIDRPNDGVEIGGTWIDSDYFRTAVNTESKYLLLSHAFETEAVHRIQLQTDLRNERSQRAIERIGGVREAVLRENMVLRTGFRRSSVVYSILVSEWPAVRARLRSMLDRPAAPRAGSERLGRTAGSPPSERRG